MHSLKRSLGELTENEKSKLNKDLQDNFTAPISTLEKAISDIDEKLASIIIENDTLRAQVEIAKSVPGIGHTTAMALLVATGGFTRFVSGKQIACYSGVVPFSYSSGSSIRGRGKVSKKSDKRLKSLLHMCACSVILIPGELQDYYKRKVAEGKSKMCVINAVRNKLIQRVFACVRDGVEYDKNYNHSLA